MGANATETKAVMENYASVLRDMIDVLSESNVKAWAGVDQELFEERAAQVTFNADSDVANLTGTRTAGSAAVQTTNFNLYLTELKKLDAAYMPLFIALNNKDWDEIDALLATGTFSTVVTDIETARGNIATSNTQAGAGAANVFGAVNASTSLFTNLEAAIIARRNKQYNEVERLLKLIDAQLVTIDNNISNIILLS